MSKFTKEMVDDYADKLLIGLTPEENKMVLDEFDVIDEQINIINDIPGIENVEPMTHALDDFEYDEKEKKWDFCHNPFSKPVLEEGQDYESANLEDIVAHQFDFVANGFELASGAIRNTDLDLLEKGFEKVGYPKGTLEKRFTSLATAFKYGAPPHGGMAPGIDRILMIIQDEPNLREVQAFPCNSSGQDAMMGAPSVLDDKQLEELGIKIEKEE